MSAADPQPASQQQNADGSSTAPVPPLGMSSSSARSTGSGGGVRPRPPNTARSTVSFSSAGRSGRRHSPRQHRDDEWVPSHQLEGDGLITGFYNFLHKKNNKTMKACCGVMIPDTIVYELNFPRGWYMTDVGRDSESNQKVPEVMQRPGKELDAATINNHFKVVPSKSVGIVASFMSCAESEGAMHTRVEFFNERTLEKFLERKTKPAGILQKFVVPKGGARNTVIQAVWSPRVLCVWRRQNRNNLDNMAQCLRDPYPIAVTYDGPSHFSEESTCASNTVVDIKHICAEIVRHFYQTMEHKFLTRMVLYFKVDEHDQIWLMWCGSLRVADKERLEPATVNFAPRNDAPSSEAQKEEWEDEQLAEMDGKYMHLAPDAMFRVRYIDGGTALSASRSPSRRGDSPTGTARSSQHGGSSAHGGSTTRSVMLGDLSSYSSTAAGGGAASTAAGSDAGDDVTQQQLQQQQQNESWYRNPNIHDHYIELTAAREKVLSHLDDIFYAAYGHFLRYEPGPFMFTVDKTVARTLGFDQLGEAMISGGVLKASPALSSAIAGDMDDEDDLYYEIPARRTQGPISKIGDAVKAWVHQHYEKLIEDLKEEAASILPLSAAASASAAQRGAARSDLQQRREEKAQREDLSREERTERGRISKAEQAEILDISRDHVAMRGQEMDKEMRRVEEMRQQEAQMQQREREEREAEAMREHQAREIERQLTEMQKTEGTARSRLSQDEFNGRNELDREATASYRSAMERTRERLAAEAAAHPRTPTPPVAATAAAEEQQEQQGEEQQTESLNITADSDAAAPQPAIAEGADATAAAGDEPVAAAPQPAIAEGADATAAAGVEPVAAAPTEDGAAAGDDANQEQQQQQDQSDEATFTAGTADDAEQPEDVRDSNYNEDFDEEEL